MALVYQRLARFGHRMKKFKITLHKEIFYEHFLNNLPPPPFSTNAIVIKKLKKSECKIIHQVWGVDLDKCEKRLNNGHSECYLSFVEDELVGYHWVQFRDKHYIQQANRYLTLEDGKDFMIYHTRVKEQYQGRGINKFILSTILHDYALKGFQRGFIYTSSENIANRKGIENLGFIKYTEIKSLLIGKKYYLLTKHPF